MFTFSRSRSWIPYKEVIKKCWIFYLVFRWIVTYHSLQLGLLNPMYWRGLPLVQKRMHMQEFVTFNVMGFAVRECYCVLVWWWDCSTWCGTLFPLACCGVYLGCHISSGDLHLVGSMGDEIFWLALLMICSPRLISALMLESFLEFMYSEPYVLARLAYVCFRNYSTRFRMLVWCERFNTSCQSGTSSFTTRPFRTFVPVFYRSNLLASAISLGNAMVETWNRYDSIQSLSSWKSQLRRGWLNWTRGNL